jgi:predicted nucleic acid-binding protein
VYVDSGAWIAHASRRDRHHGEAHSLFQQIAERRLPLLTTNLVLAEVHRLLLFQAGIRAALGALEAIEKVRPLSIEFVGKTHHAAALDWIRRFADQPFTYTDAASFAVMSARQCRRFIGFDHHFEVAGFDRWRR